MASSSILPPSLTLTHLWPIADQLDHARAGEAWSAYVCMHRDDYTALADLAIPPELRQAIADAYELGGTAQKLYIGVCGCWGEGESCRVCADLPRIREIM